MVREDWTTDAAPRINDFGYDDFTETEFVNLLDLAAVRFRFETYGTSSTDRHVIWRHDIDMSVHRALRLATLEAERGLRATYFVHLRSRFYSVVEREISRRLAEIAALGHTIGLHFEASAYGDVVDVPALETHLAFEKRLLKNVTGLDAEAFSFHNPELDKVLNFDGETYAGMINTYGREFRTRYAYSSDSNGYWRFQPLRSVLLGTHDRLQVLTHPEWWTPTPMSPRERVSRCIEGRARAVLEEYDDTLRRGGRINVR